MPPLRRIIRHNHVTVLEITIISSELDQKPTTQAHAESHQQPIWHVVVLGTLTASLYLAWWAFKTWKLLKQEASDPEKLSAHSALSLFKNVNPGLRTVAILAAPLTDLIPFVDPILKRIIGEAIIIFVIATLVVGIATLVPDEKSFSRKHPLAACGLLIGLALVWNGIAKIPGAWYLVALPAYAVPCALVQHWLNKYWRAVEPQGLIVRHGFNGIEMVAIIAGALLFGVNAAGLMIGVKPPGS